MKRHLIFAGVVLALITTPALGGWVYEGQWGKAGSGNGEFNGAAHIAVAGNGNVYVCDVLNHRVQYFTSSGSYLGKWGSTGTGNGQFKSTYGVTVMPKTGYVYVADTENCRIQYFTSTGSFLGKWGTQGTSDGQFYYPHDAAFGHLNGYIYVADSINMRVQYFTTAGSYLGKWNKSVPGPNFGIGISPKTGSVYVTGGEYGVARFTPTGSFLNEWYIQQGLPDGVAVSPDGAVVFVVASNLCQCHYFTSAGSFLGAWGSKGSGKGEFERPWGVGVSPDGRRVYVSDINGQRVQYFRDTTALTPASVGRVKALFR
jgi:DNA-binding beta-propeller fold protein YncE